MICDNCPRHCRIDRTISKGFCGESETLRLARAGLHFFEEPCISGTRGSGTIFFSGCNLRCVYCQNFDVSRGLVGKEITPTRLAEIFRELEESGAYNINLVTPSHFALQIIEALDIYRPHIPIIYNTSGYDSMDTIRKLRGYIDIFLCDFKYFDPVLAGKYSLAKDYPSVVKSVLPIMREIVGEDTFDSDGIMQKGLIIRHLVLPNCTNDSVKILEWIAENMKGTIVSIMSQYVPCGQAKKYKEIDRKISRLEYKRVLNKYLSLGLSGGYMQGFDSASESFIPVFDLSGV